MKLDALGGVSPGADSHQFVLVGRPCGLLELLGEVCRVHDQAVIPRGGKGVRQPGQQPLPVVPDFAGLPVHQSIGPDDLGPERLGDTLVAQTDSEDGNLPVEVSDKVAT